MKKVSEIKNRIKFLETAILIRDKNDPIVKAMKVEIAALEWVIGGKDY